MRDDSGNGWGIRLVSLIVLFLLLTSCSSLSAGGSGSGRTPESPESTMEGDVPPGFGDEPSGSEDSELDDMEVVPLVDEFCPNDEQQFILDYILVDLVWEGPPHILLTSGGYSRFLQYTPTYAEDAGTFALIDTSFAPIEIEVTWPDCRKEPLKATTTFIPDVKGTCQAGRISLQTNEEWKSKTLFIPCEANSDICGDEPCTISYPLPFAWGYAGYMSLPTFVLQPDGSIFPDEMELPFLGAGGYGKKKYVLTWVK